MRLPTAALAARRAFAAASHSGHEGGGQCVFTVTPEQTQTLFDVTQVHLGPVVEH